MPNLLTMIRLSLGLGVLALFAGATARAADACGDYMDEETREIVETAIDGPIADAKDAIEILRARGWEGVYALSAYEHREKKADRRARIRAILDKVAGQKDAHAARLFWHTDLDEAKAAAAKRKLPILSLRLLGRLDEDLSCANSRYFRTVLYADARVHHYLRQHYVLHWKSVRPVPVMTIDFGDGRTVCRTVTGNSAHYVLDADGRPLDVLPGLQDAKRFRAHLEAGHALERRLRDLHPDKRALALALHHAAAGSRLDRAFLEDLEAVGDARGAPTLAAYDAKARASTSVRNTPPSARRAAPVAVGKRAVEIPAVRAIQPDVMDVVADSDGAVWRKVAGLPRHAAELGKGSLALMRSKVPAMDDEAFARMAATFRRAVLTDTVRNEYDLHRRIHAWFARSQAGDDVEALNERVYDELFLTPSSDPWLGLVPAHAYSALDGGGLTTARDAHPLAQASTSR